MKVSEQRARQYVRDVLIIRGWNTASVAKKGQNIEEGEYKNYDNLKTIFKGKSKSGSGDGYPDFLLVDSYTGLRPVIVIETKATSKDSEKALNEAIHYGNALRDKNIDVLSIGVAGNENDLCIIRVAKYIKGEWKELTLHGNPIDWIPSLTQTLTILENKKTEVEPERPSENVLNDYANRLNELLRECKIKDEYRPVYAATFMLAMWQGEVSINPDIVLDQINSNAEKALKKAHKSELAQSLRVDSENETLASKAWEIIEILNKLNIKSFIHEHDYLGQLYETFFRYTGGNTIGQYFTPRHIINHLCDLLEITNDDTILDPACGTGGFLIGALNRMVKQVKRPYYEAVDIIKNNLFGIESEPSTAALCITNMIFRGDGKSGIVKGDCFKKEFKNYPDKEVDFVLMNPPFPHKKTDTPPTDFIDRGLSQLKKRGVLGSIIPYSLLVNTNEWHRKILANNSILYIATLPPDLFNPYASYNTALIVIEKGIPQNNKRTFVCRITNDGFKLKKNNRIQQEGSQLDSLLDHYRRHNEIDELCAYPTISIDSLEWSPEAYINSRPGNDTEFINGLEQHIRKHAAFYIQNGWRLHNKQATLIADIKLDYSVFIYSSSIALEGLEFGKLNINDYFDIKLGGKDEIEDMDVGDTPIVSTSEFMNGVTAWKTPRQKYEYPVITIATDGSVCSSFVQEYPFYAFYKIALLTPKKEYSNIINVDSLYYIAYLLFREKWKYVYARKFGKKRIELTTLSVPYKNGSPDFGKMAQIVRNIKSYSIIEGFRKAFE